MIRLRETRGKVAELQEAFKFVEVCDLDGNIAMLIYTDSNGAVQIIRATDTKKADQYCAMYPGAKFCPIIPLKDPATP